MKAGGELRLASAAAAPPGGAAAGKHYAQTRGQDKSGQKSCVNVRRAPA